MKRKSKLKRILVTVVALILVAAIGAGVWFYADTNVEPAKVFSFYNIGMTEYWGDSQESYGYVRTDRVQTIYLSGTQTVTEILVSPGSEVKKGDVLMTFDTTLSDLTVERKRLSVEKLKLQLEDAKEQLRVINSMKPMVIPQPSDEEEEINQGVALTDPYLISTQSKFDGSSRETALICWLHSSTAIDDEIFEALRKQAETFQALNAEQPSDLPEANAEDPAAPSDDPAEPTDEPTDPTKPTKADQFYVVFKVTSGNMSLGNRTTWQGIRVKVTEDGSFRFQFYDAASFADHTLAEGEEAPETPQIDFGSGFTSAQIAQMRNEQQKTIKDLEFNIKMAETEYQIMLTEVNDGKIYAEVDGIVVSLLTEEEAQQTGQPLMKISGGGGFYVDCTISELDRDTVTIGSEVFINDWRSGMIYTGTIRSIGDFPSANSYWSGIGNPTATSYPLTVYVEENADLQSGSYVNITYSAGSSQNGIYLENPFLRTENGRSYVYVRGADGMLEQRFVTTGKSLWGSYTEILSGITPDDFLAFPYGTGLKSGVPTTEADIYELYE